MAAFGFMLVICAVSLSLRPGDSKSFTDSLLSVSRKSLTPGVCAECSQIIEVSTNMISSKHTLEAIYESLHSLCRRLPSEQTAQCDSQVKTYLPKVLQHTAGDLNPDEACKFFGLCAVQSGQEVKLTHQATAAEQQLNPTCTLCVYVIKKLETLLPKNMTEETLQKLMTEVCDLLPESYKEECDDFVEKYGAEIIEFLLSSAAPHSICALLHLCLFQEVTTKETFLPSDCESCRTLAVLSRLHLGLNATETQASSFLQSVCSLHPRAIPKCEAFTKIYGARLQKVLQNQKAYPDVCESAELCTVKTTVEPLGKNRCTWGPSYWCKDMMTAQTCGYVAFCEKRVWQ
ncbi:surfactant protein Bb [Genypterus blacodes]|uniref:surfactant protein Bb n=1 Tax=Genypterus blacodes TaxID=154954 RepID=UPI003F759987